MNPCELTASVTAVANVLAANLCEDDLELAAVIFSLLGETLDTIIVQRAICEKHQHSKRDEEVLA